MKHIISSTALVMALSMTPALAAANSFDNQNTAHERCKNDENNRQVLGGLAGAVAGGVFGSQVSGNGARTEGSAIGAVLGGLAGVGIADKTIDCDPVFDTPEHQAPVYQTSGSTYPTGSYPTGSYPSAQTTYGNSQNQVGARTYASTPSYGNSQTYGGSQPIYEDRVTISNHPVYSDPYYGAGGLSQGSTYSAGTVSYPPSGNNSQYASQTYSAKPTYRSAPTYSTTPSYSSAPTYSSIQGARVYQASTTPVYSQTASQPVTHRAVYQSAPQPTYRPRQAHRTSHSNAHRHGRYSCNMTH